MANRKSIEEKGGSFKRCRIGLSVCNALLLIVSFQTAGGCAATKATLLSKQQTEPGETELKHNLFHRPDRVCLVRTPPKELLPPK